MSTREARATAIRTLRDQAARARRIIRTAAGEARLADLTADQLRAILTMHVEAEALESVADELEAMPIEVHRAIAAWQDRRAAAQAHRDTEAARAQVRAENSDDEGHIGGDEEPPTITPNELTRTLGKPTVNPWTDADVYAAAMAASPLANLKTERHAEKE